MGRAAGSRLACLARAEGDSLSLRGPSGMNVRELVLPPQGGRRTVLVIDGRPVPVTLRRHRAARRLILRIDARGDGVVVTVPWGASFADALDFAASQAGWIWAQTRRKPDLVPLRPGSEVPVRGLIHQVVHRHGGRRPVWIEAGEPPRLCVSGDLPHAERRISDWLKAEARRDLLAASSAYARRMNARFSRLTVRDTTSRWGSCSTTGALSYSWRLVLAPASVLDYVAAHEVAHLIEMNHGRAFWGLVEAHCPGAAEARRWLKRNGHALHRYGAAGGRDLS